MPDNEFRQVPDAIADTKSEPELVSAEKVVVVEPETNEAASDQELSPAVIAQKQEDSRQWDEAFPGFKGQNDALPADMQAQMWRNKALSTSTTTIPDKDEGPGRPEVVPLPLMDPAVVQKRYEQAVEDGDTDAKIAAQAELAAFHRGAIETVNSYGMQNEFDIRKSDARIARLELPQTIRRAGADIAGFDEADVPAALQLVESGRVPDPALAVGHAVCARLVASKSAVPPTAAEIAARKAAATVAASSPDSAPTTQKTRFTGDGTFTSPGMQEAMATDDRTEAAAAK